MAEVHSAIQGERKQRLESVLEFFDAAWWVTVPRLAAWAVPEMFLGFKAAGRTTITRQRS
jgi:hypothetical protein